MSELARIVVPWDAERTSENGLPTHRMARAGVIKQARGLAYRAWEAAGKPTFRERVRARAVIRRGQALDPSNLDGSLKSCLDGIFVGLLYFVRAGNTRRQVKLAGMLPDDSAKWLEWGGTTQEVNPRWRGREEVVVIVEPLLAPPARRAGEGT